jgi:hypothetical protein
MRLAVAPAEDSRLTRLRYACLKQLLVVAHVPLLMMHHCMAESWQPSHIYVNSCLLPANLTSHACVGTGPVIDVIGSVAV